MQCTSYGTVYYHARDLNVGASGFSSHLFNGNANYGEESGNDFSLPRYNMEEYLGYDKEVLRQIIQNHETTFRYQVQELHRLYRRQKELMDEMRMREIFAQHLLSKTSESFHSLSHARSDISQATSHATSWLLGDRLHSNLSELTAENIQRPPNFSTENFQEHATVYDGPFIRKNSYNEVKFLSSRSKGNENRILDLELPPPFKERNLSEAPELTCNTLHPATDSEIGSVKTGDFSSSNLNRSKTNCFFDLNEPIQLESLPSSSTCHTEVMHNNPFVSVEGKDSGLLNCDGSSVAIDLNSVPVDCFSEMEINLENVRPIKKEATAVLDFNSAYDHAMRKEKCVEDRSIKTKIDGKFLKTECDIDLNTNLILDEPSPPLSSSTVQIKSAGNTDLEGPVSPENEECSPPRGKSEDIQTEKPSLLSEHGMGEQSMELDIIAAQTLVKISSSGAESLVNSTNSLCWFAEIASATGDDLENELLSKMVFDFGAKTLNLSEENTSNMSCVVQKEKETGTSSVRSIKGHTRGTRQQKNSRTDVRTIEGILETGTLRKNAGKKACAKPRKYSKLSPDVVKKSMSSILKQPATRSKQGVLQSWGKIKKRQGGLRRMASKFLVIS
ncbi:hypothetical protein DH2020_013083 [Rehmannia glutinosa]|uniref:Uncharacterized protein n=1 Tax=Rehmannia glutinosa TaxID=99300 RepID=A0ABR0X1Z4_REHGL